MTDIGDILDADWFALARFIIERDGEQDLYNGLVEYVNGCAWLRSKSEREEYALDLHMSRIFDNQDWVGYLEFNKKHRPHRILQNRDKMLIGIDDTFQFNCNQCGKWLFTDLGLYRLIVFMYEM